MLSKYLNDPKHVHSCRGMSFRACIKALKTFLLIVITLVGLWSIVATGGSGGGGSSGSGGTISGSGV
jgi:hypothetical protein